ncbi:OB-fold-containig protein [Acinetobacter nosocomialis]|uniref:OB-fold-containig protein n=1 Tax=Acinetobacter nosocomialis TaxID=106654 RepID=UPI0024DE6F5D|nr:OB-fold-containig protein [Acinetobacter nosocomialis]
MADFFFNYYLMPFHLSVVALILLSVVETIGMYIGLRPSQLLKKIAPDWLTNSSILNVKFSKALIFVFLLINFSFAGYFLQLSFFAIQHYFITPFYLIIPALVIAIFFTVFMIHCLDQVIKPKHTHTNYNLLGRLATISSGSARPGFSAQARVRDEFGQLHYVQVEPEYGELELYSQVILIKVHKSHYVAKKISLSNDLFAPD